MSTYVRKKPLPQSRKADLLANSVKRNRVMGRKLLQIHTRRLRHFIQRAYERWGLKIDAFDCLILEERLERGEGKYIRPGHSEEESREARLISMRGKKMIVIYNREGFSLITCLKPTKAIKQKIANNELDELTKNYKTPLAREEKG